MAGAPASAEGTNDPERLEGAAGPRAADVAATVPALIWSATLDGDLDWINPAWTTFTGEPTRSLRGARWLDVVHPEDLERCVGIRATSFEAGTPYEMDIRLRRHDGHYRWMFDQGVPRLDASGRVLGYVGSLVDIEDRKGLEEALAERTRALRLAERRQAQFLATLSHEMRNPLAPISNAASVLRSLEHSNPILVRLREIIERQVGKLGRLIEELVDATRAAQGQISLVREPASMESVVQAAVARCHDRITAGGHKLDVRIVDEGLFVCGDLGRLAQALGMVIDNAAKFSPEPGPITITLRRMAKTVHVTVADRGRGIDAAFLPHAFELFSQGDQAFGRTVGGLGVGLSLARRIAQLHGGDVEAHSEGAGRGTEVILWLPLLDDDGAQAVAATPAGRAMRDSHRVLIVEDNADALESLRLQMALWGNEVATAGNAAEALVAADSMRPQIVLCDLGLPGMDGLTLARALREKLGRGVVLAALTGHATEDDHRRAIDAGFDAFLVKPVQSDSLARLLRLTP